MSSTFDKESSTRRTARLFLRGRIFRMRIVAVISLAIVAAVGAVAAALIVSSRTHDHAPMTTSNSATWATPSNEVNAPSVQIPGGAFLNMGSFNAVSCPSPSTCIAVGANNSLQGIAAFSSNDGTSWSTGTLPTGLPQLNAIDCATTTFCVAVGQGVVATSVDGGLNWSAVSIPTKSTTLLGVACPNTSFCVSVGVSPQVAGPYVGEILVSNDGGAAWSVPATPRLVGAMGSVACPTTSRCVAVGAGVMTSDDGGKSWAQNVVGGGTGVLRAVSCASASQCVAIGPAPFGSAGSTTAFEVTSADGGATWLSVTPPNGSGNVDSISCTAAGCTISGPAIASGLIPVYSSTSSGTAWVAQTPPSSLSNVSSISCSSGGNCVLIGTPTTTPAAGGLTPNSRHPIRVSSARVRQESRR